MNAEPATLLPRSRWQRWRFRLAFLAVALGFSGYGLWREYDFRCAIREVTALGWEWKYDDPFEVIQKDWRAAFDKKTWTDGKRELVISLADSTEGKGPLLRRLAPRQLALGCRDNYNKLANLEMLKDCPKLRSLRVIGFRELDDLKALHEFSELEYLCFTNCNIESFDGIGSLARLRWIYFLDSTLPEPKNAEALKGLTGLRNLEYYGQGWNGSSSTTYEAFKAALPNTKITFSILPSRREMEDFRRRVGR